MKEDRFSVILYGDIYALRKSERCIFLKWKQYIHKVYIQQHYEIYIL